ncbi:MAG: hypothetical protein ACI9OJ_001448 [Myxococcota bacterium]|jgi:hypothetical protein
MLLVQRVAILRLMSRIPVILMVLLMGLPASASSQRTASSESVISGQVRGGGEHYGLTVVALRSRLLTSGIMAQSPVQTTSGAFELRLPNDTPVFLFVTAGCEPSNQNLADCRRFFPRHGFASTIDSPILLQVPELQEMADVFAGTRAAPGPLRPVGTTVIIVTLLACAWLWRRPTSNHPPLESAPAPTRWDWLIFVVAAVLLVAFTGTRDLDLLEYSYFHEGVRPLSVSALFSDSISAELAHGPVMPLCLRGMAAISTSPWFLRLPSMLFGLAFVWVTGRLVARLCGARAATGVLLIVATAPVAVVYARDASPYALAGLCSVLAIDLALRLKSTSNPLVWILFSLVHVVGIFTHYGFVFFSVALALALIVAWLRPAPRALAKALSALAFAAILPTLMAPNLEHMFLSSGVRFTLMSPIYLPSPGLLEFMVTFLAVLFGLPVVASWALIVIIPAWGIGTTILWRRHRTLALITIAQAVVVVVWLVFSHTLSTQVGGERVFYAFRWTRPLLLGLWIPLGFLAVSKLRPVVALFAIWTGVWSATLGPLAHHPDQEAAVATVESESQAGEAYAVLPAAFYSDPVQYYLADKSPPDLITQMRERELPVATGSIRGPLVEIDYTLETLTDRLDHAGLWVFAYRETMLGVPKFDPGATARTVAHLDQAMSRLSHQTWRWLDLYHYGCDTSCQWRGQDRLTVALADRLGTLRYRAGIVPPALPQPDSALELVFPGDTRSIRATGRVRFESAQLKNTKRDGNATIATFKPSERVRFTLHSDTSLSGVILEATR